MRSVDWTAPSIRIAACGLGTVLGGPLGGLLGGWLGNALGPSAVDLIARYAEKFGEGAGTKLLDLGADVLVHDSTARPPESELLYRETLRLTFSEISTSIPGNGFGDWFDNWQLCLASAIPLDFSGIKLDQLGRGNPDDQLRLALETFDAQGSAVVRNDLSLKLIPRTLPDELLSLLKAKFPKFLDKNFRGLIIEPRYERAFREELLIFERSASKALEDIDQTTQRTEVKVDRIGDDTKAIRELLERVFKSAIEQGRVSSEQLKNKDAEIARLAEQLRELKGELAARSSEPDEARLSRLLAAGDLEGALRLKSSQVKARRSEAQMLPRDLFELGRLHELRFDWPNALEAYREAWNTRKDREFGFAYAGSAQRQNHFSEAIGVYQSLLLTSENPNGRAALLNNLGSLYRDTQRMKEAEAAYGEALSKYRELAKANPEAYLPYVAGTLNNLANLYRATQRMKDAESCCWEAKSILEPVWQADPEAYGDALARILLMEATLCESLGKPNTEACGFAKRAFETAYQDHLKSIAHDMLDALQCGK